VRTRPGKLACPRRVHNRPGRTPARALAYTQSRWLPSSQGAAQHTPGPIAVQRRQPRYATWATAKSDGAEAATAITPGHREAPPEQRRTGSHRIAESLMLTVAGAPRRVQHGAWIGVRRSAHDWPYLGIDHARALADDNDGGACNSHVGAAGAGVRNVLMLPSLRSGSRARSPAGVTADVWSGDRCLTQMQRFQVGKLT
jgi:hypothetical protein